ncbi:MAG: hypothetical protein LC667_06050, partial [Thioalkalivibrio sp.]|nr:hypothetical protein [Thioalkalivibrio sp.]
MASIPAGSLYPEIVDTLTASSSRVRGWCAAVILLAFVISPSASSQEEEAAEWAIKAPLAAESLMLDAADAGGALVAVGARGHILISSDGGGTWTQSDVPTRATLTGVFFHDRNLGWAVGHDAVILKTTDGGVNWERMQWAPDEETPLLDLWLADAETGYAIGAYGSYYVTTDGGETWDFEPISEDDFHLNRIASAGDGRLYIAAEAGMVYRSDDQGATWSELSMPYIGSFFGVLPLEGETVLMFGLRGHLYRSEDAGDSWTEIDTGTIAMLNDGLRLDDGTIVIVG